MLLLDMNSPLGWMALTNPEEDRKVLSVSWSEYIEEKTVLVSQS
jgi:hypothetical protein